MLFRSFCLFSLFGRLLFPFGDEPDFTVRAPSVLNHDLHSWWSPFSIFSNFFTLLDVASECVVTASPFSLTSHIDPISCFESIDQITIRLMLTLLIVSPLFIVVLFGRFFFGVLGLFSKRKHLEDIEQRISVLSLTILFPGVIYYLGVFSVEQFTLLLSLLIFIFWSNRIIILILLGMLFSIDFGNSIVVASFVISAWFYSYLSKKFSYKTILILMFIQVCTFYVVGYQVLEITAQLPYIADKSIAMMQVFENGELDEKYPVILRPVITFMTFVFMTPSYIKVPVLYLFVGFSAFFGLLKFRLKYKKMKLSYSDEGESFKNDLLLFFVAISLILSFVFMFPAYGNAKYYIFSTPFIISAFMRVFKFRNVFFFMIFLDTILFAHLLMYRL